MNKKNKKRLIRIIISSILLLAFIIINAIYKLDEIIKDDKISFLLPLSITLTIYFIISYDILLKAFKNIIHGQIFDENLLMIIATIGAFVIKEYPEAVFVMIFYQVGELFEAIAVGKSRKSIKNLIDLTPKTARMYVDGNITEVEPYEINIGDLFEVLPGEKIALDGVIYKGDSYLDTKALTGESKYQEVFEGKEVLSGSININKPIIVKATKIYDDSTATKILEMVENAADKKTNSEKFISKFAKYYTPIVVLLALLLAIIPSIIYKNPSEYIRRALNFLVVSCPCALVISIPLSFFAGIGSSSKEGILVKGSNYLEMLSKAKTIVFDKTGTITKGVFEISRVEGENTLYLASICEKKSNHPIALAIKNKMIAKEDYDIEEKAGFGIIARKKDDVIYCGNSRLLKENNISFDEINSPGTILYVARNNKYEGYILISDVIKDNAKAEILKIKKKGLKTVMLTGDNEQVAKLVAKEAEIDEYHASLLPHEKYEIIDKLESENKTIYVGDGINDAPSLVRSSVGISMGMIGSDVAIEASDIVITKDDLSQINKALDISKRTLRISYENIFFSIFVKILVLVLSALGYAPIWLAIFADVGVLILCILNSMRAMFYKNKKD